jgi:hypothetical protein
MLRWFQHAADVGGFLHAACFDWWFQHAACYDGCYIQPFDVCQNLKFVPSGNAVLGTQGRQTRDKGKGKAEGKTN